MCDTHHMCDTHRTCVTWVMTRMNRPRHIWLRHATHGGDQTSNIWISRFISFPDRSFECRGLCLLTWKFVWRFGNSRENVFDMYGDSRENSFEILAVVNILSPISSVCGYTRMSHVTESHRVTWVMSHMYVTWLIHTGYDSYDFTDSYGTWLIWFHTWRIWIDTDQWPHLRINVSYRVAKIHRMP